MWILIQEWLAFIIFVWGVYELFSGVAFWEKLIRSNLPKNIKTIIARFIGLIWIILGGIWMFSFRTELNSQGFLPVLLILSFFVLLLQSILVIIVGEKGMAKQIRELIGSFREVFYVDEENYYELPPRIWGLLIFIISVVVIACVLISIPLHR